MMVLLLLLFSWACLGISYLLPTVMVPARQKTITIKYKQAGLSSCIVTPQSTHREEKRRERKRQLYPQKGEVPVVLDAGYLQVAHDHLTVLIVLAQGSILLLQVRERAQLVLCSCTHCQEKKIQRKLYNLSMTCTMTMSLSTLYPPHCILFPQIKVFFMPLYP